MMALEAEATFDTMAPPKATGLNDNSPKEAKATPPMTGRRVKYTGMGRKDFKKIPDNKADTAGSAA